MTTVTITHAHLFCGLGGGAKGFNAAQARVGTLRGQFRCLGGIDVDPAAIRDFERLSGAPGTCMDLFSRDQYRAFHGQEPPQGWREAGPEDIRAAFGGQLPHIVFTSAPCKGFSGLLSQSKSSSAKYQALNQLTLRGIWLLLEAYGDDPVPLIVFENVPRIASRGRHLLDQITALLRQYGYAVAETTHDCGHLGGLAQSRKRFLLVARHQEKVPSFLYQPDKKPLRAVGDVLSRMPLPGDPAAGPMHRIPALQWKTWVRLAFVEAGSDWRSLNKLAVVDGFLRDYGIVPERTLQNGIYGVVPWGGHVGTVRGRTGVGNGPFAVADPRGTGEIHCKYFVTPYDAPANSVIGGSTTGQGCYAVQDVRCAWLASAHTNKYRILPWDNSARTVIGAAIPADGALCVADPRSEKTKHNNTYRVVSLADAAGTITGGCTPSSGGQSVADPRTGWDRQSTGHSRDGVYGVVAWDSPASPVTARGRCDNGKHSVADPRLAAALPEATHNCIAIIRAMDGTWHRPFTTMELAALQGLLDPEEQLELDGLSDSAWRERIGNAVPPPAAQAIAQVMGEVLLLTAAGETFSMSQTPIWVRPMAAALMSARG